MPMLLVLVLPVTALAAQVRHEFTEVHLGVATRLVLYVDVIEAPAAARAAFDRIASLEDKMSDWRPESEVNRLARRAGEWVEVSAELHDVLRRGLEIAAATGGAYDPTVAPLVTLWRETQRTGALPEPAALDSARALVDWRRVSVDSCRPLVRLGPGVRIDLGGIAKGYILAAALAQLRTRGVRAAFIEAGGDIVVGDPPPGRSGWKIRIGNVDREYTNVAVSTSGTGAQYVEVAGQRYAHVVDPRTGLGLRASRTVTVVAADATTADALATALVIVGPAAGGRVLSRFPGVVAMWRD